MNRTPTTDLKQLQTIVHGDSCCHPQYDEKELEQRAQEEGWVLDPKVPIPGFKNKARIIMKAKALLVPTPYRAPTTID